MEPNQDSFFVSQEQHEAASENAHQEEVTEVTAREAAHAPRDHNQEAVSPETQPVQEAAPPVEQSIEERAAAAGVTIFEMRRRDTQSERDRYRSQAEKLEKELVALREQSLQPDEELAAAKQLLDLAKQDSAFRDHLSSFNFDTGTGQTTPTAAPAAQPVGALPERPTPPERPPNYSEFDALQDQESDSWKFRVANEAFKDQDREWLASRFAYEDNMRAAAQQQQQMAISRERELDTIATRAVTQYGVPQDQLADYRKAIGSLSPEQEEEAFAFYFKNRGRPSAESLVARQKEENLKRDQELRREFPAAAASSPAASAAVDEPEQFFTRTGGQRSLTS